MPHVWHSVHYNYMYTVHYIEFLLLLKVFPYLDPENAIEFLKGIKEKVCFY